MGKLELLVSFLLIAGVLIIGLTALYGVWYLLLRFIPGLQHWANQQIANCEKRWNNEEDE